MRKHFSLKTPLLQIYLKGDFLNNPYSLLTLLKPNWTFCSSSSRGVELKIKISFRVAINSIVCLSSNKEWTVYNKPPSSSLVNCLHFTSRPSYFYCLHYPAKLPWHIKSQTRDGQHNARVPESRTLSEQGDLGFNISVNSCQKSSVTFRLIENPVQRLLLDWDFGTCLALSWITSPIIVTHRFVLRSQEGLKNRWYPLHKPQKTAGLWIFNLFLEWIEVIGRYVGGKWKVRQIT